MSGCPPQSVQTTVETQRAGPDSRLAFAAGGEEHYRAVSVPATIGFILGALSPLAFFHPVLWAIPLLAVGASLFGLRQIRRYAPSLTGRKAAQAGVALAVICGVGAAVHAGLHRALIDREAARVGKLWLEYVLAGQLHEAHQMSLDPRVRLPVTTDLADEYAELPKLQNEYEEFTKGAFIKGLRKFPNSTRVEFLNIRTHFVVGLRERVQANYKLTYDQDNQPRTRYAQLLMHRLKYTPTGEIAWWVVPVATVYDRADELP